MAANHGGEHWEWRYRRGHLAWETGRPSSELVRIFTERRLAPMRAIDLGCGTGINALWLAGRGCEVVGVDISSTAISMARARAGATGAQVRFETVDLLDTSFREGPFDFVFDRGCYHHLRTLDLDGYRRTIERITAPGTLWLIIAGNASEPRCGPPVVAEREMRDELASLFTIVQLRAFRLDRSIDAPAEHLAWSCLARRR